ncbi:MAG: hypothetical protein RBR49_07565 [Desulfovibrio desulfuricans]|nr:hypothetical protein [Desulfovibrio desulfuricans]
MEDGSQATASSGFATPEERPRCSIKVESSAACPASKGEGTGLAAFVFAARFGGSAEAASSSSAAEEAAEEEEEEEEESAEGAEEAGERSPQSRNPSSVCAAWRIIIALTYRLINKFFIFPLGVNRRMGGGNYFNLFQAILLAAL